MLALTRHGAPSRSLALLALLVLLSVLIVAEQVAGQGSVYGSRLGLRGVDGQAGYRPTGVTVYTDALDPSVGRWYLPPVFFSEAGRLQDEYVNYAREPYRRFVGETQQGDFFYDTFGNQIVRGWRIYNWEQSQPTVSGGSVISQTRQYAAEDNNDWFDHLVVSSDVSRGRGYSITIGDEIQAMLTPLTFRKAGFNGVVTSYTARGFNATGLFSRISDPVLLGSSTRSHFTNLMGGRAVADLSDHLSVGFTFLNSHNTSAKLESFKGNPFKGALNQEQLAGRLNLLVIRLSDDSPEDDEGGAILFGDDVEITTTLMRPVIGSDPLTFAPVDTVIIGSDINWPLNEPGISHVEGGRLVEGFRHASGVDEIKLTYALSDGRSDEALPPGPGTLEAQLIDELFLTPEEAIDAISNIRDVRFRLVLANDYRVEITSNRQNDAFGVPQFNLITRAEGNIKNQLNQQEVVFDYGLPTANQILGFTTEVRDFHGLDFYGEFNINNSYRMYPGIQRQDAEGRNQREEHRAISGIEGNDQAIAFMMNLSYRSGPWHVFAEGFGMDDDYTTSVRPIQAEGAVDYDPDVTRVEYDYIDDNDDNDRHPDQLRFQQGGLIFNPLNPDGGVQTRGFADPEVFPGYDENGDFISDFNQNSNFNRQNFFPDYEEPFLRYRTDRPEFLFGIDLNNNGWIERFENDDLPDYPYNKDHWGYNVYTGVEIIPGSMVRVGQLRETMEKTERENVTTYGIFSAEHDAPWGRVRAFEMLKKANDDIADDLVQWVIPRTDFGAAAITSGQNQLVRDHLAAEDTWINTLYGDYDYDSPNGWRTFHRFKWETWHQRQDDITYLLDAEGNRVLEDEDGNVVEEGGDPVIVFDPLGPEGRNARDTSGFIGLINKVEYVRHLGRLTVDPRFKSEYLSEVPFSRTLDKRRSWDGIFFLRLGYPILTTTELQAGFEQRYFYNLRGDEDTLAAGDFTGDFSGSVVALQLTNRSQYLGYALVTQVGIRIDRRSLEVTGSDNESDTSGLTFLTIVAGLD